MSTLLETNTKAKTSVEPRSTLSEASDSGGLNGGVSNLQPQVTLLTNSITNEAVRIVVGKVFADLVFLLDYLSIVETSAQDSARILERLSIVHAVRGEACSLVEFIENHAMHVEGLGELLTETLDGFAYAIKHEVRRIFDGELAQSKFDQDDQKVHGSLLHAQGVLTNCFQQCMISLARVFDESVTGARLFQDWQVRRERSLFLSCDLTALIELVKDGGAEPLDYIADQLKWFREGSMQWLMYKDWKDYEALSEEIIIAIMNQERPTDLLNRLECYLETLLSHVKARAVLADLEAEPCCVYEDVALS